MMSFPDFISGIFLAVRPLQQSKQDPH